MPKHSLFDRLRRRALREFLGRETRNGAYFTTARARPKTAAAIGFAASDFPSYSTQPALRASSAAIVMQGPIWTRDNFTLETLRLYRKLMPDCPIVLSTWQDTPRAQLEPLTGLDIDIVFNEKPDVPGPSNLNMQIVSAAGGMKQAAEFGVEWVLKTRTDQRLHHPTFMSGMIALARLIPPSGAAAQTQKHRVFGLAHGTLKFLPYHLCDQTVFGHMEDMLSYWTPPLHDGVLPERFPPARARVFREVSLGDFRYAAAESYLASQFLLKQGRRLDWTVADGWAAYRDHFGVLDLWSSDLYWAKFHGYSLRDGFGSYAALTNARELSFLEWMELVGGELTPEKAGPYERILDECVTSFDAGYP